MDIQPQQPISDDQELAKVLAGITANADQTVVPTDLAGDLGQEVAGSSSSKTPAASAAAADDAPASAPPIPPTPPVPAAPATSIGAPSNGEGGLESIKHDALNELRPLVDKLNVSPEEKFDTYLLLIRSTDDVALIAPAHDAAQGITDEARRAQALLDIIKEIDYLSGPRQQVA
jgi:hypothetical protein